MNIRVVLVTLIVSFWFSTGYATSSSVDEQRLLFEDWQKNYKSLKVDEQQQKLSLLKGYPLYPYAQYQYLTANLTELTNDEINQFMTENADFPLSSALMKNYIEMLAKKKNWNNITQLNIDKSLASQCRYQLALFNQGKKNEALKPVKQMWLSANELPSACDPLFNEWSKTAEKTANIVLLRIEMVLEKKNISLARYITAQLPDNYKLIKKNLLAVYDNPKKLDDFSKNIAPTPFSKKVVLFSFPRLVRKDTKYALSLIPKLIKRQKLTPADEIKLLRDVAMSYFNASATDEQKAWRDEFIAKHRDTVLIEKRIRLALKDDSLQNVEYWLNLLPEADKQKDEWLYWQAIVLSNKNQVEKANKILRELVNGRGFYAMYSAQKLGEIYHFNFEYPVVKNLSAKAEQDFLNEKYHNLPVIKRIEELRNLSMLAQASLEWRYYLHSDMDNKHYAEIARYAYLKGWGEHSVQATIAGKLWNNWIERFPVVHHKLFTEYTQDKSIPLSYVLAITRQESALDATVQSPSGARGLMQLMPATAKDSAKKIDFTEYHSSKQLYEPRVNIKLGTYYLDYVYQRFSKNRILASAAYNAGPNRVAQWLRESGVDIDAIAFIESIPFTETRNYVKSVLVYDYIYQLVLHGKPKTILTEPELLAQQYHNAID